MNRQPKPKFRVGQVVYITGIIRHLVLDGTEAVIEPLGASPMRYFCVPLRRLTAREKGETRKGKGK